MQHHRDQSGSPVYAARRPSLTPYGELLLATVGTSNARPLCPLDTNVLQYPARLAQRQHLVDVANSTDAEELIVVGHSSGSFLGTEIMARALQLDRDLGGHGSRVVLLTIGGNLPIVGFLEASHKFRDNLRCLAVEPSIDGIDCQSRKDVMNFYPFDPSSDTASKSATPGATLPSCRSGSGRSSGPITTTVPLEVFSRAFPIRDGETSDPMPMIFS